MELLKILLSNGADPNAVISEYHGSQSVTPLHLAVDVANIEAIQLLLEYGAKIDAETKKNRTPLGWAILGSDSNEKLHSKEIIDILLKNGSIIQPHDIHQAMLGEYDIFEFILMNSNVACVKKTLNIFNSLRGNKARRALKYLDIFVLRDNLKLFKKDSKDLDKVVNIIKNNFNEIIRCCVDDNISQLSFAIGNGYLAVIKSLIDNGIRVELSHIIESLDQKYEVFECIMMNTKIEDINNALSQKMFKQKEKIGIYGFYPTKSSEIEKFFEGNLIGNKEGYNSIKSYLLYMRNFGKGFMFGDFKIIISNLFVSKDNNDINEWNGGDSRLKVDIETTAIDGDVVKVNEVIEAEIQNDGSIYLLAFSNQSYNYYGMCFDPVFIERNHIEMTELLETIKRNAQEKTFDTSDDPIDKYRYVNRGDYGDKLSNYLKELEKQVTIRGNENEIIKCNAIVQKVYGVVQGTSSEQIPKGRTQKKNTTTEVPMTKSWLSTFFLCWILGMFGAHRFYTGHIVSGIVQLLTFGGLGIWAFIDWILILTNNFKDKKGNKIIRRAGEGKKVLKILGAFLAALLLIGVIIISSGSSKAGSSSSIKQEKVIPQKKKALSPLHKVVKPTLKHLESNK